MRGSERTEKPTKTAGETKKKEEKPESYSRPEPDTNIVCSRYRELAADHIQATGTGSRRATEATHQITGAADQTYLTVKDFMRAERAGTDVTGCSRRSTGRMISELLQLDILTIEQHYRRNTEQQENKCFSGAGSGSRYRDHSRAERARKGLFISAWGYSCRKYSAFTGGRTEGQKRFIL